MLTKPDLNKPAFKMNPMLAINVKMGVCPFCKKSIDPNSFEDELSRKEYSISGLCKKCQDNIFG